MCLLTLFRMILEEATRRPSGVLCNERYFCYYVCLERIVIPAIVVSVTVFMFFNTCLLDEEQSYIVKQVWFNYMYTDF